MQIMPATVSSFNAAGAQLDLNYHTQPSSIPEDYCMHHHDHGFCNYNSYANPNMDSSFNRAGAHYKPSSCFNSHGGLRRISPIAPCRRSVLNSCLQSPKTPPSPPVHGSSPGPWHGRSSSAHEGNFGSSSPNSVLQQVLNSPHECDAILIQPNSMTNISSGMQPPVKKKMKRTPSPSSIASAPCPLGMSGDFCFSGSSPTVWVSLEEAVHAQDENTVADLLIQGYNPNDTTSFGVYAGLNQSTGELMAVKEIKVKEISGPEERAMYLASLEREIGLYKTLRHRYIVGYIDMEMDETTGSLYIFLEYVPGGSIQRMLERFGRFSDPVVKVYTRQLLLGLEYLHSNNIIHRDLKGGNVLVDTDGIVKLADFGASKTLPVATVNSKTTDCCNSIRGSVFWMAPEVIKGDGYGRKADIWSVGCTVLEMLTASHPWPEMDNAWAAIFHLAQSNSGPPLPDGIPDVVKDFLGKCFQVNPKERPTATELLRHPFLQMDTA